MIKGKKAKKKSLMTGSDFTSKNLYATKESPDSPPPLMPPDLSLGPRPFAPRPAQPQVGSHSPKNWHDSQRKSEVLTKASVKQGNDWY
jgi:hypothetical protein